MSPTIFNGIGTSIKAHVSPSRHNVVLANSMRLNNSCGSYSTAWRNFRCLFMKADKSKGGAMQSVQRFQPNLNNRKN